MANWQDGDWRKRALDREDRRQRAQDEEDRRMWKQDEEDRRQRAQDEEDKRARAQDQEDRRRREVNEEYGDDYGGEEKWICSDCGGAQVGREAKEPCPWCGLSGTVVRMSDNPVAASGQAAAACADVVAVSVIILALALYSLARLSRTTGKRP